LSSFGEQLHNDFRDGARHMQSVAWWHRLPRDMAMHPFHSIRSREGQTTCQHFVKCDAQGVEIAPGINRTIHSSGLLRRHVTECSGDKLGGLGRLALAGKPRGDPETHKPDLSSGSVNENISRSNILVDQPTFVDSP